MKTFFYAIFALISISSAAQQLYEKSGGVRLGHTSGITFKKFVTEDEAVEMILSGRNEGMQYTATYLFHQPMEFSFNDRFYLHYGIGGHVGYEKFDDISKTLSNAAGDEFIYESKSFFTMGVDASLGIEYRWLEVPATFGFDIKPYFNFIGMRHTKARFWDAAISFKYVF
ncbi:MULTISPECIES: hypothetical protein [unclassified Ekhidna]|uniref:hypothetical protein n=1 Tax=unclassified Ekhidna TaxID=2632188 RepID=UPI0032DF9942